MNENEQLPEPDRIDITGDRWTHIGGDMWECHDSDGLQLPLAEVEAIHGPTRSTDGADQ